MNVMKDKLLVVSWKGLNFIKLIEVEATYSCEWRKSWNEDEYIEYIAVEKSKRWLGSCKKEKTWSCAREV